MTFCRRSLVCVLLAHLLIVVSLGQSTPVAQRSTSQNGRPVSAEVQRALNEFEEILAVAREIDDSELRIRFQAAAADVLWRVDEQRARQLFTLASGAIQAPPPTDSPSMTSGGEAFRLQTELLISAISRDPALAESLVKTAIGEEARPGPWRSYRGMLMMNAAYYLAQRDPQRAAQMAKAAYEVIPADSNADQMFNSVLNSMKPKNAALGDELFGHAISVLSGQPDRVLRNISWMASYLFPDFRRPPAQESPQPAQPDAARYLNLVHDAAAQMATKSPSTLSGHVENLAALLPYFERYAPEKGVSMGEILERMPRRPTPPSSIATPAVEPAAVAENSNNTTLKDEALRRTAMKCLNERQFEKALAAAGQITDESGRSRTLEQIHGSAAPIAMRMGDLEAGIRHAREISRPDLRASLFSQAIDTLVRKKLEKEALALLDEAWRWIQGASRSTEKADGMLRLAGEAAVARLPAAFQMMESVVNEINLTDFAPAWRKETWIDVVTGDGKTTVGLETGVGRLANNFGRSLGMLSREDFERAMTLARRIRPNEMSVFARLAICRDAFASAPR